VSPKDLSDLCSSHSRHSTADISSQRATILNFVRFAFSPEGSVADTECPDRAGLFARPDQGGGIAGMGCEGQIELGPASRPPRSGAATATAVRLPFLVGAGLQDRRPVAPGRE
jgi:hypothetical protein